MKCPKCKKPSELQTKRTKANGREVVRNRYCRKCKNRFITIERFDTDIAEAESKYERKIQQLDMHRENLREMIGEYEALFLGLKNAIHRAADKKRS